MGTEKLQTTSEERDLGVIVSEDLKVSRQCIKIANIYIFIHRFGRNIKRNNKNNRKETQRKYLPNK